MVKQISSPDEHAQGSLRGAFRRLQAAHLRRINADRHDVLTPGGISQHIHENRPKLLVPTHVRPESRYCPVKLLCHTEAGFALPPERR